jgi:signal transduction histidine kinase
MPMAEARRSWTLGTLGFLPRILILGLIVGLGTLQAVPRPDSWRGAGAWAVTALFLALFAIGRQRALPALLLAAGLLAALLQVLSPSSAAIIAAYATVVGTALYLPPRPAGLVVGVIIVAFLAALFLDVRHPSPGGIILQTVGLAFASVTGASVARLRREQQRTAALLEEVVAGRDAQIRAAALDERARLAREMHDVLAHTLAALSIQLEGTRLLAEGRDSAPDVVAALDRAAGLAREGLAEARQAVGSLRDEALPGPDRLPALAEAFACDTGTPCTLQVEGEARELAPQVRLALYRAAQEALTNVRKHAAASRVAITLRYGRDEVSLCVENDGPSRPSPVPGGGFGLAGMRERAELLGGRLEAGPLEAGYRVSLRIPT